MEDTQRKQLRTITRLFAAARSSISPVVPTQVVQTFLTVAMHEGKSLSELAELIGTNLSTASRQLLDLGDYDRRQKPGYALLMRREDPTDLRRSVYTLTPKGRLVANQLIDILESAQ